MYGVGGETYAAVVVVLAVLRIGEVSQRPHVFVLFQCFCDNLPFAAALPRSFLTESRALGRAGHAVSITLKHVSCLPLATA